MKVFVIVVTYKGHKWYDRCFSSLRKSTVPVQTIVVDNASNDGTAEYIRENFPEIHLIESEENLGFGQANNLGMRYALDHGCDYVFLLNQDTCITPDSIEELVKLHDVNREFGILSPMHLTGSMAHLNILFNDGNTRPNYELISDLYCGNVKDVYEENYINAAAWLISRQTLEIVGGFDPLYLQYAEDDDYLNRLHYHGLKVGLCPRISIVHDHTNLENPFLKRNGRYKHEQYLALEFANVNKNLSIRKHLVYLMRKSIVAELRGDKVLSCQMREDFIYLRKMRRRIELSRETNMRVQSSWL